jgi:hypothetical protein
VCRGFATYRWKVLDEGDKKWHLGVALVANHGEYYKGEVGGFLEV